MKIRLSTLLTLFALWLPFLLAACNGGHETGQPEPAQEQSSLQITTPPAALLDKVGALDRDAARKFYTKYLDVKGVALMAGAAVSDEAMVRDYDIVTHMLAGRPDILQTMAARGTRLIIIGKDELYSDMPEYRRAPNAAYNE
jgi:hypothetical protein